MRWLPVSATYSGPAPAAAAAMPCGALNKAALPAPSALPAVPGAPARVPV
jgi:hypothetical protein